MRALEFLLEIHTKLYYNSKFSHSSRVIYMLPVLNKKINKKNCLTAANDRKGSTLGSMYHEAVLSAIHPVYINA
jgi:hypothetical protein